MELEDFLKKFLPDYKVKAEDYRRSFYSSNPVNWEMFGKTDFHKDNFHKALQNYTDFICEKQRDCVNDYWKTNFRNYMGCREAILNAQQPKIQEL